MENTINTKDFSYRFGKHLHEKGISNDDYFKCLNLLLDYGGVKTVSKFAEENNISVQHVYQTQKVKTVLGRKVIFDNE